METRMGIEDSLKHSLGPCVSASGSLAVSMYPSGEKGVTFMPSVSEEGVLSWENNGGMVNPSPVNIHGTNIEKVEQIQKSEEDDGINIIQVTLSNGETSNFEVQNGSKGNPATIQVGETTTGGEQIRVTNSGTENDVILNFSFPPVATTVNLNGEINPAPVMYAPINSGSEGDILVSNGDGQAPKWKQNNYNIMQYFSSGTLTDLISKTDFRQSLIDFKENIENAKKPIYELVCTSNEVIENAPKTANYGYTEVVEKDEENLLASSNNEEIHYYSAFFDNINYSLIENGFKYSMSAFIQGTNYFGVNCNNGIININVEYSNEDLKIDISILENRFLPTSNDKNCFIDFEDNELIYTITTDTNFTQEDLDRINEILDGNIEATEEDLEKYDLNGNGTIQRIDLWRIQSLFVEKNFSKDNPLKIKINKQGSISFLDGLGTAYSQIGLKQVDTEKVTSEEVHTSKIYIDNIQFGPTVLYEGDPTISDQDVIELNESVLGYEYLEIYFQNNDGQKGMTKVSVGIGTTFPAKVSLFTINSYGNYCFFKAKTISIEGKQISNDSNYYSEVMFDENGITVKNDNYITIEKVLGYKI